MSKEPFPRTAALCDKWERISQHPGALSMKQLQTTVKKLVAELVGSHLQLEKELAATKSEIAPCTKCGKTPPFDGGTRCQDLQCPFVQWSHTSQSATPALPEDVRAFIYRVTLHLQSESDSAARRTMFHDAHSLYAKYKVEYGA